MALFAGACPCFVRRSVPQGEIWFAFGRPVLLGYMQTKDRKLIIDSDGGGTGVAFPPDKSLNWSECANLMWVDSH